MMRHKAIAAGFDLPPSYTETLEVQSKLKKTTLTSYLKGPTFTSDLVNMILVLWVVRHALPWARFEDPALRGAFFTVNRGATVRSRTWAAQKLVILFSGLHEKAINKVKNNKGKFCLVHDVWTTKGNRYAFIGATANYIDDEWNYQSTHLTLKMIAWRHFGALLARPVGRFLTRNGLHKQMLAQTTDSGSNNGPMASELQSMFLDAEDPVAWDASTNHVRCYAHKLNLTVGHGLKLLGQKVSIAKACVPHNQPLPIPVLEVNDGEDEVEIDNDESDDENDAGLPEKPDGVDEDDTNETLETSGVACKKDDLVAVALAKIDAVSGQIASSAARRSDFKARATRMGYKGQMLKRPCKTRWNSHFES